MSEKQSRLSLARLKKYGKTFELSIDPEQALKFKKGLLSDVTEALQAERIFLDARKGLVASSQDLQQAFSTTDVLQAAAVILREGEIQGTGEQRSQEREQRRRKLVHLIHTMAVDPKTGYPHPPQRIEAALEQGKINLDDHHTVEEQLDGIIQKLRPIIPLKIEQKQLIVILPAALASKFLKMVSSLGKVMQDDWQNDGSWKGTLEIPAGLVQEAIGKLNSWTHGEAIVEVKVK